jgi:chemotaxis protein methyltransferase CheR
MVDPDLKFYLGVRDLIYARSGLFFEEKKFYFLRRRIDQRVEDVGASSVLDYFQMLRFGADTTEIQALCESVTTNETYFFREFPQLKAFADVCLPEVLADKRKRGDYNLRVWSAACSTGDEAYTLAIILREVIDDFDKWVVTLVATDIDREALRTARKAIYTERAVKDVPVVYRQKYFQPEGYTYRVSPLITRMVQFRHANLMDPAVAGEMTGQDFVFCRNVLIYFDDASRRRTLELFYDALRPGGYIFLGHSESVGRITSAFRLLRKSDQLVYMK